MKKIIAILMLGLFLLNQDAYPDMTENEKAILDTKVIACLPFTGEAKYNDFATSSFWQKLSKNKYINVVEIDKVQDAVDDLQININNISDRDILEISKKLKCDAVFKCSIEKVIVPLIIKEINAEVELIDPDGFEVIFTTKQSSGQLVSISLESIASDAAKNAARQFNLKVKKIHRKYNK